MDGLDSRGGGSRRFRRLGRGPAAGLRRVQRGHDGRTWRPMVSGLRAVLLAAGLLFGPRLLRVPTALLRQFVGRLLRAPEPGRGVLGPRRRAEVSIPAGRMPVGADGRLPGRPTVGNVVGARPASKSYAGARSASAAADPARVDHSASAGAWRRWAQGESSVAVYSHKPCTVFNRNIGRMSVGEAGVFPLVGPRAVDYTFTRES
jgi:hypothetical protein